jgi:phage terminase large subunit
MPRTRLPMLELEGATDSSEDEKPPEALGVSSLVLDRDHVFSDLYYKKARYKVYWGGRGSGKSWAIAEALIRLCAAVPLRVLCLREYQNSIADSSHKVLKDTIERLGMTSWFDVTDKKITSRTGSEIIFKGCFGQLNSIRSTEGIDICWLEEAHSISEASWRVIIPTIRKQGSEIWCSFNMDDENDATYRRLVAKPRPDAIVHLVNYDKNPYFKDSPLYAEMVFDKMADYQLYEHIWEGKPKRVSNAIVLNKKYAVREFADDLWKEADRLRLGLDFGYSQDPSALTRSFILDNQTLETENGILHGRRLFIEHEEYGTGIEINELPDWIRHMPGAESWPIGADNSLPATISYLKNQGLNIHGAEKWPGSVEDGIKYLRGFIEIVIHPRCQYTKREAHLWRWKVDPKIVDEHGQPQVLPVLVDKDNHTWDSIRYGHDGEIERGGILGVWSKLGQEALPAQRH